jgi:formylglycine-generating enzyme required for sulfatase activity
MDGGDSGDDGPPIVEVSGVALNKTATVILKGGNETLIATISPVDATKQNVIWSSGDTDVATVSNGVVTAVAAGSAAIIVTTEDGGYTAGCAVTVTAYDISLTPSGTCIFPLATVGYGPQTAQSVMIRNTGSQATGALTLGLSGAGSSSFALSATLVNSIALWGTGSFTVVPHIGLTAGTYTATVTVSGGNGISVNFTVSFIVLPSYIMKAVPAGTVSTENTGSGNTDNWEAGKNSAYIKPYSMNAFSIGETEITYELWYAVRSWAESIGGYTFANPGREGNDGTDGAVPTTAKQEPVTWISWRDAVVWCNAYSEAAGRAPVYKYNSAVLRESEDSTVNEGSGKAELAIADTAASGFRLPTEAAWEYAARGGVPGTGTPWTYTYAGSNTADGVAVHSGNSGNNTAVVKSKSANSLDLYDMSGNVWEGCQDRIDMGALSLPIIRGGNWSSDAGFCIVAYRNIGTSSYRNNIVGFRVVCP